MERYRTTIIMAVLLIALGSTAYFLTRNNASSTNATPTATAVQYVWQSNDPVSAIDVVSGTGKVSLVKSNSADSAAGTWTLTAPIKGAADSFSVGSIAEQLKSLQTTNVVTGTGDLAQYKLDKPGLTITATYSDTQHTKRAIQVGSATFDGSGYYTKQDNSPTVYIVSNSFLEPVRQWLQTPPVAQPTPTTAPLQIAPTLTATATAPPGTPPVGASGTLTNSQPITVTGPGAANPTTPIPATLPAVTRTP
ncbi:MAG: DUF4340 domain-containing protein [Chloroflexota bacterium]|nr:DUF4340 domain-containing protein [Chloroflexota bacterium]